MGRCSLPTFLFVILGMALFQRNALAKPQDASAKEEARRILLQASQLVKDIPEGQQSSAAANIAGQLARAGDLEAALETIHQLKKSDDQALPLGIIAWQMDHAGNAAGALSLLENSDLGQNKAQAYQQLALSQLDRGDFKDAVQIMDLVQPNPYLRVDLFVRIAEKKEKSGDLTGAHEAIQQALDIVGKVRKEDPTSAIQMVGIAGAQADMGDQAGALDTINRFSEIVHDYRQGEGPMAKDSLLQQLATGQARIGDVMGAFRTIDELQAGSSLRDIPLNIIATQQARNGDLQEALNTLTEVSDATLKGFGLREIGAMEGTSGKLVEALEAINRIPDLGARADALATLALEQAEKDDPTAGRTLQLAVEATSEPGAKVPGYVFATIAVTRAVMKDFSGAQESVVSINDAEWRAWPLWNITSMMAEAGDAQGALSLAANEQAAHPKAYALLGTAQGILNHDKAEVESKSKSTGTAN